MSTTPQNMLPKDDIWDKQMKLGPLDYTYKVWLMILLVFVAVYVYFTRCHDPAAAGLAADATSKGYYYY
jgi:hypothetical protein